MAEVYDLEHITAHVRSAIKRSGIKRNVIARMNRFGRIASMLLDPEISFPMVWSSDLTVSDLYGAMWMLLVADTFRGDGEQAGIAGDFFRFTADEAALLDPVWSLLHERYFGIPPRATVVIRKDREP
jgi:hypothetical protein